MYVAFGSGNKQIIIYNADKRPDVDVMLSRIASSYKALLAAGYPNIARVERGCKLIFTSDMPICGSLTIYITSRPHGIYTDVQAYHKQLARVLYSATGFDVLQTSGSDADLEIGIGNMDAGTQGYVMLKDAIPEFTF